MINAPVAVRTTWKSSRIPVQIDVNCSTLADINKEQKIFSPSMINAPVAVRTTWKISGMLVQLDVNSHF